MSLWSDIIQGIPSNPVLRERVALSEQKYKDMEVENKRLMEHIASLKEENEAMKRRIEDAPIAVAQPKVTPAVTNGLYFFDGDRTKLYCPRCYETQGKKNALASVRHLGHKCPVCGNFIPK